MTTRITAETLSPITYSQFPVITTELLAQLYGTEINNIKVNFTRNAERFVRGKHYFKVAGNELKNLRVTLSNSQNSLSPKTRSLILWTERGAARHAKMLETDQAWEVFEKLEDCYFSRKSSPAVQEDMFVSEPEPLTVTIPKEGRWLVVYRSGSHKVINVDGHNVVEVDFINKLQRDTNLLIQLMRDYHIRTQVLKGDRSGDILNIPLVK